MAASCLPAYRPASRCWAHVPRAFRVPSSLRPFETRAVLRISQVLRFTLLAAELSFPFILYLSEQAVYVACWARSLPLTPADSEKEPTPWEWNSATVLIMMLAVLWAAFLTRGGLVDETKRAACAWCALMFTGGFILLSFSWPALGLGGTNVTSSIILGVEIVVLLVAAAI